MHGVSPQPFINHGDEGDCPPQQLLQVQFSHFPGSMNEWWKNWLCVMNACFFSLYTSVRLARFHLWSKVRGFLITVLEPIVRQVDGSTLHRIFCSWCSSEIIFGSPLTNVCQIHKQMHMSDQTGSHQSPCTGFGVGVGQARRKHLPSKENWWVYVTRIRLYHF